MSDDTYPPHRWPEGEGNEKKEYGMQVRNAQGVLENAPLTKQGVRNLDKIFPPSKRVQNGKSDDPGKLFCSHTPVKKAYLAGERVWWECSKCGREVNP